MARFPAFRWDEVDVMERWSLSARRRPDKLTCRERSGPLPKTRKLQLMVALLADRSVQEGRLQILIRNQILILAMPPKPTGGIAAYGHRLQFFRAHNMH